MGLRDQRAAAYKAAQDLLETAKAEDRAFTDDEQTEFDAKVAEVETLDEKIKKADESKLLVKRLADAPIPEGDPGEPGRDTDETGGTIASRFVKSGAFREFRKAHPSGVGNGTPFRVEAKGMGGIDDLGVGAKATISTETGQFVGQQRLPGYRSELLDDPVTFLNLITTGTTNATYLEYARIVSETDNAAIVPEGELKPLSDIATDVADAKAYTYADGFDVTNQTMSDDGALVSFMDSRIRWHLTNLIEDKLLNGTGAGTEPQGILNTTGIQAQTFDTDAITTLAAALEKVESVQVAPQAIVMNPVDIWKFRLLRENGATGSYLLGNPLQQGVTPTPFGVPLVRSTRVAAGTAVVGNFSSVQFLQREPLTVLAFNQHKDYAQRNMTYVRAELRGLQMIYAPREIVVANIAESGAA